MIIWLASYPKSGNTWLRAILHQIVVNKTEKEETWLSNLHKLVDTYPKIQHFQDLNSSLVEGTDFKNKSEIIIKIEKIEKTSFNVKNKKTKNKYDPDCKLIPSYMFKELTSTKKQNTVTKILRFSNSKEIFKVSISIDFRTS